MSVTLENHGNNKFICTKRVICLYFDKILYLFEYSTKFAILLELCLLSL